MKAVQIVKPNQLEVIDIEKPVIDSKNNVLVKMTAAYHFLICFHIINLDFT